MGFRFGHTITTSIANEAERAYFEGAHAALDLADLLGTEKGKRLRNTLAKRAAEYGDRVHDDLAIPREGSRRDRRREEEE